jgi:hypothetical protein
MTRMSTTSRLLYLYKPFQSISQLSAQRSDQNPVRILGRVCDNLVMAEAGRVILGEHHATYAYEGLMSKSIRVTRIPIACFQLKFISLELDRFSDRM